MEPRQKEERKEEKRRLVLEYAPILAGLIIGIMVLIAAYMFYDSVGKLPHRCTHLLVENVGANVLIPKVPGVCVVELNGIPGDLFYLCVNNKGIGIYPVEVNAVSLGVLEKYRKVCVGEVNVG